MARSYTIPDLYDAHGRVPRGARVRAYRCDTHAFVEEALVDANGQATFSSLPEDVDVSFHTLWGGTTARRDNQWFFSRVIQVSEGGTGASDADTARTNLGVASDGTRWAFILGG